MQEQIRSLETPEAFKKRQTAKITSEAIETGYVLFSRAEKTKLQRIVDTLSEERVEQLANEGKVTLAIIKPEANVGRDLPETDQEAADFISTQIGEKELFSISLLVTRSQAEKFYAPIKEKYIQRFTESGITIWESIINFTTSGPLTFVLIYDEGGQAVEWWRDKIGHTRADRATAESIRGKHAKVENLPNNLVHGSESRDEAKREIGVLREIIEETLAKSTSLTA